MRFPVNNFKEQWNTTAGYGFGAKTDYGYHDGVDINLNGGGDSDLGQPIFAIANGKLVYYHKGSHPTKNFGYHSVYKIEGPFGTRWIHQAHMMDDFTIGAQDIKEGQQIGRVGKSGTVWAHIHFSIFKVDPSTLPNGIDTIATTSKQLNDWWEDPIAFIEKHLINNVKKIEIDTDTFEQLVGKSTEYDKFVAGGYPHIEDVLKALEEKEKIISDVRGDNKKLLERNEQLLKSAEKVNDEDLKNTEHVIDSEKALQPYKDNDEKIRRELGIFEESDIIEAIKALKKSKVKKEEVPTAFTQRFIYCLNLLFARG